MSLFDKNSDLLPLLQHEKLSVLCQKVWPFRYEVRIYPDCPNPISVLLVSGPNIIGSYNLNRSSKNGLWLTR
jgi:hypothetical protein